MVKGSVAQLREVSKELHLRVRETDNNILALIPNQETAVGTASDIGAGSDRLAPDHFKVRDGKVFAGTHLLIEMWGAKNLSDPDQIGAALALAASAAGATILHSYMHPFGPEMGVSGVVVLAESHISIHTWPERGYAALDIFMCGACDPYDAVSALKAAFRPGRVTIDEQRRGVVG